MDDNEQMNQTNSNNGNRPRPGNFGRPSGQSENSKGPAIGIVIIILILIIGGIYIFTTRQGNEVIPGDRQSEELLNQGTSTRLDAIEKDAAATNLDSLDRELGDIEQELKTLGQ